MTQPNTSVPDTQRDLEEITVGLLLHPVNPEESKAMDEAFGFSVPEKGGEVPTDEGPAEKKVKKQMKGTRSKIVNTVGIVVLSGLSFLAADNVKAQSAPPTENKPAATASTETGQKQEKIDPWHIVRLADGSQTKIVQMKDGRYILGIILPDGKKVKGEMNTKDPKVAEALAIQYIIQYNETAIAEKEANQAEKEANQAEKELAQEKQALNAAYQKADQLNADLEKKMQEALNQAMQKTKK